MQTCQFLAWKIIGLSWRGRKRLVDCSEGLPSQGLFLVGLNPVADDRVHGAGWAVLECSQGLECSGIDGRNPCGVVGLGGHLGRDGLVARACEEHYAVAGACEGRYCMGLGTIEDAGKTVCVDSYRR